MLARTTIALALPLLFAGCASPRQDRVDATQPLPAQWRNAAPADNAISTIDPQWWRTFGSDELSGLIALAQAQSLDVAAAVARVRQAEASARIAGAALLPAVTGTLDASREARLGGNASVDGTWVGATLSASYEVDVWGRLSAARGSALATLQASRFDRDAVQWTVTTGVASAWLQAVALRERVTIGERSLASAERLLVLVESRSRAGAATPLELAQQRGLVASQRRSVEALRQQAGEACTAVSILLGQTGALDLGAVRLASLEVPRIGAGIPTALLTRRPDIARAEAQLAAGDADVQVARAAMLPSLTLTGSVETGGNRLRRVFDNPLYSLAAGLAAPIFDGGRLAAERDLALAQRQELVATYRSAIVDAFGDVEVALNAVTGMDAQMSSQSEELAQAQRALTLAESRYRAGSDTLLTLLDTQRTLYTAQDTAVQLQAQRLQAAVALFKALGGGWQKPVDAAAVAVAAERTTP